MLSQCNIIDYILFLATFLQAQINPGDNYGFA